MLAAAKQTYPTELAGLNAWVRHFLDNPQMIDETIDPSYTAALAMIAAKREALRHADNAGPMGKTAGWSPTKQHKIDAEFPYVAALLLKAAFGRDALSNNRKRNLILQQYPEFSLRIRR